MKKSNIVLMTVVTALVAGTTIVTSCNKEDEVINDVPAMEMKLAEPPTDNDTVVGGITSVIWYWHRDEPDPGTNMIFKKTCRAGYTPYGICLIVVTRPTSGEDDIHAATWLDGNGIIKSMEIESANMSSDVKKSFLELVEKGTITFEENCPITAPELLAVSKTDHIPAGTYPIKLEKDNFVITISE